ncbi:carcinoembryonic antigen-related cell adhesion molecule 1 isoform X2 [Camelus dromedarius]|uniref:carcinoembryonic antigen-related cell adhesion molecule 1 isoform X2 n=1 Tax=Camelus dromedarius TaxID=9838 RepID=UPI003119F91A
MEPSSAPAHRGHVLWQRVLLAVSLLTFWNLPTTTQLSIESVPVNAAEGTDVLLLVYNVTEDLLGYGWFKGEKVENSQQIASYIVSSQVNVPGPAYSGRETIYANGSLLFQNVFQNDTGYYTIIVTTNHFDSKAASGQLRVFPKLPTPVVTSNNLNPLEHEDTVVLTCEPETQNTTYMWWINNRSLPDSTRLELSEDNRTLTLLHVTRNDTGPYVCETQNPGKKSPQLSARGPLLASWLGSWLQWYWWLPWGVSISLQGLKAIVACRTTECAAPQRPPLDMVPLAALSLWLPNLTLSQLFPSTRNYYTPTETFTMGSITKQMWFPHLFLEMLLKGGREGPC